MGERDSHPERALLYGVYFIYFFCGMVQCLEGVFLPEFKEYFGLFALGRLVGAGVQKRIKPTITLVVCAAAALLLVGVIVVAHGTVAIVSVTVIGFFISIFFPTLYALAIEGLGKGTAPASGLLTMGFLGCAFLPVIQGWLADRLGLQHSYAMLFVPYLCVLFYALRAHRLERSEIAPR